MALTKVKGSGVEGITNLSNATFLSVNASEVATLLTTAVINSEGGAVTTNIAQGLCKAWIKFNGANTIAISDSFNVSGIADNGTGQYTVTVSNAFGNINYNFVGATAGDGTNGAAVYKDNGVTETTTAIRMRTKLLGNQDADRTEICVSYFGDQA